MNYKVSIEKKKMYATGAITVSCNTPKQAIAIVQDMINKKILTSDMIAWDNMQSEDDSIMVTGDVDREF